MSDIWPRRKERPAHLRMVIGTLGRPGATWNTSIYPDWPGRVKEKQRWSYLFIPLTSDCPRLLDQEDCGQGPLDQDPAIEGHGGPQCKTLLPWWNLLRW